MICQEIPRMTAEILPSFEKIAQKKQDFQGHDARVVTSVGTPKRDRCVVAEKITAHTHLLLPENEPAHARSGDAG
jgi:hypothetical protein